MTTDLSTKAEGSGLPLNMYPIFQFMDEILLIARPESNEDGLVYEVIFEKDKEPIFNWVKSVQDPQDTPVISDATRALLPSQYSQVVMAITMLIIFNFVPLRLFIAESADLTGVEFSFLTPKGKLIKHRYIRAAGEIELFPKDFLTDLLAFPRRYNLS